MGLGQPPAEGQAEAGPGLAGLQVPNLPELLEHVLEIVRRDAHPGVAYRNARLITGPAPLDDDPAAFGRELDGVGEQVVDDLAQPAAIGRDRSVLAIEHHLDRLAVSQGPQPLHRLPEGCAEREGLTLQVDPSGLDLREIQHVVDQRQEMIATAVDVLDPLVRNAALPSGEGFVAHQGREADDRAQGRPQLMAHAGQEVALRLAGLLQGLDRERQSLRKCGLFGDGPAPLGENRGTCDQRAQHGVVVRGEQARPRSQEQERTGLAARECERQRGNEWSADRPRLSREVAVHDRPAFIGRRGHRLEAGACHALAGPRLGADRGDEGATGLAGHHQRCGGPGRMTRYICQALPDGTSVFDCRDIHQVLREIECGNRAPDVPQPARRHECDNVEGGCCQSENAA